MMALFGGLDLGTPADRNRRTLTADLELRRKAGLTAARWTGYHYKGGADLVLQHGHFYVGRQVPERYAHLVGKESECFANAAAAALAEPSLRYCEGYYWTGMGYAMNHGWCLDPDGAVVELTLPSDPETLARALFRSHDGEAFRALTPERWAYFGAIFRPELVIAHFQAYDVDSAPMFDRSPGEMMTERIDTTSPHDFPILKVPYDPDRIELLP